MGQPLAVPKGKEYLFDTMETVEARDAKKKKGHPDAFGWDCFNQDSLHRGHDKKTRQLVFDEEAYKAQMQSLEAGEDSSMFAGFGFKATDASKDALEKAMDKANANKKEFSRRRGFV